jgi:hypothetical protein
MFVKKPCAQPKAPFEGVVEPSVGWISNVLKQIYSSYVVESDPKTFPMTAVHQREIKC